MNLNTVVTAAFTDEAVQTLRGFGDVRRAGWGVNKVKLTPGQMAAEIVDADIVITELDPVDAGVISACPRLKLIGCCRGTPINVDLAAATQAHIPVLFTPARNAVSVAEMTVAFMIMASRQIARANRSLMQGHWGEGGLSPYLAFRGTELNSRSVGLVGFGAIGREVASRLLPFGIKLLVYDPYVAEAVLHHFGAERVPLERLCEESDFISIHCNVTPETTGLFSRDCIRRMKPTAYFINTARAALADEAALVEALQQNLIAGAALDVFGTEPLSPDSPFLKLDNVTITPHIGGATDDVVRHHSRIITDDVARFLRGERPLFVANPDVLKGTA